MFLLFMWQFEYPSSLCSYVSLYINFCEPISVFLYPYTLGHHGRKLHNESSRITNINFRVNRALLMYLNYLIFPVCLSSFEYFHLMNCPVINSHLLSFT